MEMHSEDKWYVIYTNPRAEKRAYSLLLSRGFEVYLPLQKRLKQWSDRKKWVEEVLIPSYLFVRTGHSKLSQVLSTPGIARLIYFSGSPCSVPDGQIEQLRLLLASEMDLEFSSRSFKKGEVVEVIAGALKGMFGELIEQFSSRKLLIRIGNTGQSLLIQIPAAFLRPSEMDLNF